MRRHHDPDNHDYLGFHDNYDYLGFHDNYDHRDDDDHDHYDHQVGVESRVRRHGPAGC